MSNRSFVHWNFLEFCISSVFCALLWLMRNCLIGHPSICPILPHCKIQYPKRPAVETYGTRWLSASRLLAKGLHRITDVRKIRNICASTAQASGSHHQTPIKVRWAFGAHMRRILTVGQDVFDIRLPFANWGIHCLLHWWGASRYGGAPASEVIQHGKLAAKGAISVLTVGFLMRRVCGYRKRL